MKTVILTCNTGQGHNSVSKAIEETLFLMGEECVTVDSLSFISEHASGVISSWHTRLYRYLPKVSDTAYKLVEAHPELFEDGSIIKQFLVSGAEDLYKYLVDGHFECVICPHVFSALMVTKLRQDHPELKIKSAYITTDYTFAPITDVLDVDAYFVPDEELIDLYTSMGVPREKLYAITGIPVRRSFYKRMDKKEAKKELGLSPDGGHIVMMFGSMGCGPIPKLTSELSKLLPDNAVLTVICGTNHMLKKYLAFTYADCPNIKVEGFVDNISLLMDSADVYITKPGGLSISEARIKHLPMVLVNAVAGCEQNNLEFLLDKGAAVSANSEEETAELCIDLLLDPKKLDEMAHIFDDKSIAADELYDIMKKL